MAGCIPLALSVREFNRRRIPDIAFIKAGIRMSCAQASRCAVVFRVFAFSSHSKLCRSADNYTDFEAKTLLRSWLFSYGPLRSEADSSVLPAAEE